MGQLKSSQFASAVKISIDANVPVCIWGSTGVGKSAIIAQESRKYYDDTVAKSSYLYETDENVKRAVDAGDYQYYYADLRLATLEDGDLGIPRVYHTIRNMATGEERTVPEAALGAINWSEWNAVDSHHLETRPHWFKPEGWQGLYILNLEELNRATPGSQNAVMSITAERTLKHRRGAEGMRLFTLNNPNTGGFKTKPMDAAMLARFCHITTTANASDFLVAMREHLDPFTAEQLSGTNQDQILVVEEPWNDWKVEQQVKINPRTWALSARLGNYIIHRESLEKGWGAQNKTVLMNMFMGMRSVSESQRWWQMFESGTQISLERILEGSLTFQQLHRLGRDRVGYAIFCLAGDINDRIFNDSKGKPSQARVNNYGKFIHELAGDASLHSLLGAYTAALQSAPSSQTKSLRAVVSSSSHVQAAFKNLATAMGTIK